MLNQKWKRVLQREFIIISICLVIGLAIGIMGKINGNSGQIFYLATIFIFALLYFFIQSIRAIRWSILNLIRH